MKKLKTILQYKYFYTLLTILTITLSLALTQIPNYKSIYKENETNFNCLLEEYKIDGNKLELTLKCKEKLIGTFYFKTEEEKNKYNDLLEIGSTLQIKGNLITPTNNTVPYLFNYKNYLYNKKIYYILEIEEFQTIKKASNIFYKLKNLAYKHSNKIKNNTYIYAYILGKSYKINYEIIESYRVNGISHLFALSGLHVGIFSTLILKLLSKIKITKIKKIAITFSFLLLFSFITGFSPSILRASLLFALIGINKKYKLNIKTINILLLVLNILVILNPFIIYNISFIMSFTTTFFIIISSELIKDKNYIKGLLKVSIISFISNIGLSIYYFNYISPLGILLNLIFVPLVSFIIFPLAIITYIFPFTNNILLIFTNIMEYTSTTISNFMIKIYFPHISILELIIFYIILFIALKFKNKKQIILILLIIIFWKIKPILIAETRVYIIDVGQGDSSLIITPHTKEAILIDTGGKITFNNEKWQKRNTDTSIANTTLIPLMRNLGINKLDYLILTHGDQDHAGETINLIENFKISKVIFNNDEYNDLESKIIEVLKTKEIPYYQNIETLNINNYQLKFLNTRAYDNENDNSNVIYININNYNFLFMGDASKSKEEDIIKKYNIPDIDFLKVGHHGSKTSSTPSFINSINPKYSLISVGRNNRYSHPSGYTLNNLKKSTIYRTDIDGTIEIRINDTLKIKTYSP